MRPVWEPDSARITGHPSTIPVKERLPTILKVDGYKRIALTLPVPFRLFFLRWICVGEGVPLPRPRIQVVHGTVPQKCAGNTLLARSGILSRPALGELRCRPLPTSSARAPEVTPN